MKILIDTPVWIEYFRGKGNELERLLLENKVLTHPVIIGELSCGHLKNRNKTLGNLKLLPQAQIVEWDEVIELIESRRLYGKGLGFSDIQLLASALLSDVGIFTFDKAMLSAIKLLGITTL